MPRRRGTRRGAHSRMGSEYLGGHELRESSGPTSRTRVACRPMLLRRNKSFVDCLGCRWAGRKQWKNYTSRCLPIPYSEYGGVTYWLSMVLGDFVLFFFLSLFI